MRFPGRSAAAAGAWLALAAGLPAQAAPEAAGGARTAVAPAAPRAAGATELAAEVPFVPQGELLCGGAAAAMVLRGLGERGVGARAFASLVRPGEGGIRTDDLAAELERRGWAVDARAGDLAALARALRAERPPVVLLASARGRWHYVVVVGLGPAGVRVHDPARGPGERLDEAEFLRRWDQGRRWMMVVTGRAAAPSPDVETSPPAGAEEPPSTAALLTASERFRASDWRGAARAARIASSAAPHDARAWRLLGSSLYLTGERDAALEAWARVGEPRIDAVELGGLGRVPPTIAHDLIGLEPGTRLRRGDLQRARRRLALLGAPHARLDYSAEGGGWVQVRAAAVEGPAHPLSRVGLAAVAIGALDGEVTLWEAGLAGVGERFEVRARSGGARADLAAPRALGLPGRTEVGAMRRADGAASAWLRTTDWASGWLGWEIGARADRTGAAVVPGLGGALRLARGRTLSARAGGLAWSDGALLAALDLAAHGGDPSRRWSATARGSARAVTRGAPPGLWPTVDSRGGRALDGPFAGADPLPLLRAHDRASGTALFAGGLEAVGWTGGTVRLGIAAFVDAARVRGAAAALVDAGTGLRLALPGVPGYARLDHAWGLADGARGWSFGWTRSAGADPGG